MGIQSLTSAFSGAVSASLRRNTHDLDQFARVRGAGWAAGRVGGQAGATPFPAAGGRQKPQAGFRPAWQSEPRGVAPARPPEALGDSKRAATRAANHAATRARTTLRLARPTTRASRSEPRRDSR